MKIRGYFWNSGPKLVSHRGKSYTEVSMQACRLVCTWTNGQAGYGYQNQSQQLLLLDQVLCEGAVCVWEGGDAGK